MVRRMKTALPDEQMSLRAIRWAYWAPRQARSLRWKRLPQSRCWSASPKRGRRDSFPSTSGPDVFNRCEYRVARTVAPAASGDFLTWKEKHSRALLCADAIPCKFTNADAAWI